MLLSTEGVPIVDVSARDGAPDTGVLGDPRTILIEAKEPVQDFLVVTTTELTLVLPREVAGTGVTMAASVPATTWFVGINCTVALIDWRDRRVRASVDFLGPVFSLHVVGADEVIVVHEIGVCRLAADGRVLWSYDSSVITEHALWAGQLHLRCEDGSSTAIDLATGHLVERGGPPA